MSHADTEAAGHDLGDEVFVDLAVAVVVDAVAVVDVGRERVDDADDTLDVGRVREDVEHAVGERVDARSDGVAVEIEQDVVPVGEDAFAL